MDPAGCTPVLDESDESSVRSCVGVFTTDGGAGPLGFSDDPSLFGAAAPFRVVFAAGATGAPADPPVSFTGQTRVQQLVALRAPATYILSWFGRDVGASVASEAVELVAADGSPLVSSPVRTVPAAAGGPEGWLRYFRLYDVPSAQVVAVRIRPQGVLVPAIEQSVELAGLQLERAADRIDVLDADAGAPYLPRSFVATSDSATVRQAVCEDTNGLQFRPEWRLACERVCRQGFGRGCAASDTVQQCYHEIEFTIAEDALERGDVFGSTSIARGNFNYRLEHIAANVVGTAARDCSDESLPSTCYSAGFVPYSLYHLGGSGGYEVRNHSGDIYLAPLFDGRIEHAAALAAERYLTNPVSSADHALIDGYMRPELMGRPMAGRYVLRVWEGAGVRFEGVEDVQLVIRYRYWTRID